MYVSPSTCICDYSGLHLPSFFDPLLYDILYSPSKLLINHIYNTFQIFYYNTSAFLFSTTSIKYHAFPLLVYTFPYTSMVTKSRILCCLLSDLYITNTQTLPSLIHLLLLKKRVICHLLSNVHITT